MLRADLHVHSEASYDGSATVEEILERAREAGLDVVAVTDHDEIDASLRAADLAPEYGLVGIPGVEVSTADGHLLGVGVEEIPETGEPVEDTIKEVRSLGGIAVVPHPFQKTRHGVGGVEDCDAMETYNSRLLTGLGNRRARRFASKKGFPMVAGSDAHIASMVGRAYTVVNADPNPESVLEAIVEGETEPVGKRTPLSLSLRQFAASGRRKVTSSVRSYVGALL